MEAENKVSYYRDCRHNYMILPCTGAEKECRVGYS
jgi:hypothetical protein